MIGWPFFSLCWHWKWLKISLQWYFPQISLLLSSTINLSSSFNSCVSFVQLFALFDRVKLSRLTHSFGVILFHESILACGDWHDLSSFLTSIEATLFGSLLTSVIWFLRPIMETFNNVVNHFFIHPLTRTPEDGHPALPHMGLWQPSQSLCRIHLGSWQLS